MNKQALEELVFSDSRVTLTELEEHLGEELLFYFKLTRLYRLIPKEIEFDLESFKSAVLFESRFYINMKELMMSPNGYLRIDGFTQIRDDNIPTIAHFLPEYRVYLNFLHPNQEVTNCRLLL